MIKRFRVKNYKALRDVELELTPIHVLIGPNDSGKTSILEAIAALCRSVDHPLDDAFVGSWQGRELVWRGFRETVTFEVLGHDYRYRMSCGFEDLDRKCWRVSEQTAAPDDDFIDIGQSKGFSSSNQTFPPDSVRRGLEGVQICRFDPRFLAMPAAIVANQAFQLDPSGFGLVLCLDDIIGTNFHQFMSLEYKFREIFPEVQSIQLRRQPAFRLQEERDSEAPVLTKADGKGLYFRFRTGGVVPAAQASDGMLLILGYLTLLHLPKPLKMLLIEEPENGIHPARLRLLADILRSQKHTQTILTTHSPYVLDFFSPHEVTLCRKEQDGSISVHRLSDSQAVRDQIDIFTLGEIWTGEGDEALAESTKPQEEPAK